MRMINTIPFKYRWLRVPLCLLVLALVVAGGPWRLCGYALYGWKQIVAHNFYEIEPSRLYRSGYMSSHELAETIRTRGIKTVIDLRRGSDHPGRNGEIEKDIVENTGASYLTVKLNSGSVPGYPRIARLYNVLEKAHEPVLIHCSSGTHRSGLATFIWLLDFEKKPLEIALRQFAPKFGYYYPERLFQKFLKGRSTLDEVVWQFAEARRETGIGFKEWARRELEPVDGVYDVSGIEKSPQTKSHT